MRMRNMRAHLLRLVNDQLERLLAECAYVDEEAEEIRECFESIDARAYERESAQPPDLDGVEPF